MDPLLALVMVISSMITVVTLSAYLVPQADREQLFGGAWLLRVASGGGWLNALLGLVIGAVLTFVWIAVAFHASEPASVRIMGGIHTVLVGTWWLHILATVMRFKARSRLR